ncbi:response regulator transcription factor [Fodinicola feengrottensis]|uniref:response regulator transcription factor n=1 Tax=Fodinicola feengrottensis TaxID=435914 RepID=UPI002442034F|nr:helix-turn-helix transcriptional regulator [Fodinicola feengrottensis]
MGGARGVPRRSRPCRRVARRRGPGRRAARALRGARGARLARGRVLAGPGPALGGGGRRRHGPRGWNFRCVRSRRPALWAPSASRSTPSTTWSGWASREWRPTSWTGWQRVRRDPVRGSTPTTRGHRSTATRPHSSRCRSDLPRSDWRSTRRRRRRRPRNCTGSRPGPTTTKRSQPGSRRVAQGARTPALLLATAPTLTRRELDVARLAATGLTNQQIADRLALSRRTVEKHRRPATPSSAAPARTCPPASHRRLAHNNGVSCLFAPG